MAKHYLAPTYMMQRFFLAIVCVLTCASATPADEPLPTRAIARLGSYRFYHGPGIACAALSPDGSHIASATRDAFHYAAGKDIEAYKRVIVLWDSATGERIRELQVPHASVYHLCFSPDGKLLAVEYGREESKSGIAIFDVGTGKLHTHVAESSHSLRLVRFSRDGKSLFLTKGYRDSLVLWDLVNAKQLRLWKPLTGASEWIKGREYVHQMKASANGKFIASLVDEPPDYSKLPLDWFPPPHVPQPTVLIVTDAVTEKPLYRKVFAQGCLNTFAFSPDGQRFMTGGEKITAYETATGKALFTLDAQSTYAFALSPDGRWAVANTGASQVRLWDLESKKPSHELFSGLIPVGSQMGAEQVFSADGKMVLLVTLSTLRLFDTATGKERLLLGHRSLITPRFSADGRTLFTTCFEARRAWDISPGKKPTLLKHEPRNVWEGICGRKVVAFSADGRFFVDRKGEGLGLFETVTGDLVRDLEGSQHPIFGMFSQNATRLLVWYAAIGEDFDGFRLYDPMTGKKTGEMKTMCRVGYYPAISGDGRFIAWADRTNAVHVHDGVTGKLIRTLRSTRKLPKMECNNAGLLFSPDGEYLIATTYIHDLFKRPNETDGWVTLPTRVFNLASGREVGRFYCNPETTSKALEHSCEACSPDGRLLAVAEPESATIRLIEIASGKVRVQFTGHRHGVHAMAFSPDGKTLASGGEDGNTFLWDVISLSLEKPDNLP